MKDYYIPKTKKELKEKLERLTGPSYRGFNNKSQLYAIYFGVMDKKTDHVKSFYEKYSLV